MNIFTNRKVIISIVIFVMVVGAFFVFRGDKAFSISLFEKDEAGLAKINNDIEIFFQDNTVLSEIDQTFSDILDEGAGISADAALDEASIAQEASQANLSQILDAFEADEAALQELDQAFGEVSQ